MNPGDLYPRFQSTVETGQCGLCEMQTPPYIDICLDPGDLYTNNMWFSPENADSVKSV